jgi:hypothetical protein
MSNIRRSRALAAAALLTSSFAALPAQADVKVHGATTVTFGLMRPR